MSHAQGKRVLLALVVAYGAFYLCRANVDASFPLLHDDFGFTKTQLGELSSVSVVVYAIGKVVMGTLGDVIGGKRLMQVAMAGSVLATFAFGASGSLGAFILFAAVNRFFQSGGWSGAVHVVARRFAPERHGAVAGVLSTSYELGNVVALGLCALITHTFAGWRPLFLVNPVLLAAAGVFLTVSLPAPADASSAPPAVGATSPPAGAEADHEPTPAQIVAKLSKSPAFWLTLLLSVLLTFVRVGFLTWTPTYLAELSRAAGHPGVSAAIAKSAIFSAAGVVAALSVGTVSDAFGPGRRAPVMAVSLVVVVALIVVLAHGGLRSPAAGALLIGGVGLFLLGPYSLLAGALALDVSGKRGVATAAGIIDGAGYLGASSAGVVLGSFADKWGWSAAFDVLAAAALAATLVTAGWSVKILRDSR
jgi:sugar phosphate permease